MGNTASASAITGVTPTQATGSRASFDDKGLTHKPEMIEQILAFHRLDLANGFEILRKIDGFEIAGIAATVLTAASKKMPLCLTGLYPVQQGCWRTPST